MSTRLVSKLVPGWRNAYVVYAGAVPNLLLTWPQRGNEWSEHTPCSQQNTQLARHKTHPANSTGTDIALDLLRILHKSGLDEMILTQDLTMSSYENVCYSLLLAKYTVCASAYFVI